MCRWRGIWGSDQTLCILCNNITAEPYQLPLLIMVMLNIHENRILNHIGCISNLGKSWWCTQWFLFFFLVYKKPTTGTSLAAQWLRLCLPLQGLWVQSLFGQQRSHVPRGQKSKTWNRNNTLTDSIKTLKIVHIKNKKNRKKKKKKNRHPTSFVLNLPFKSSCPRKSSCELSLGPQTQCPAHGICSLMLDDKISSLLFFEGSE